MSQLRMGILGAASIAPAALSDPASAAGVDVVAVAARDPGRARAFAAEHGIQSAEASYEDLLSRDDLDAVYVPLPAALRYEWIMRAIAQGLHVLAEKPIGVTAAQAKEMVDAAKQANLVLLEGFHYLFHPMMRRAVELVRSGILGDLEHLDAIFELGALDEQSVVYSDPALGGGCLLHQGCYVLSLVRALTDAEPAVTRAVATIGDSGVDESFDAELLFPGNIVGQARSSMQADRPLLMRAAVRGGLAVMELDNWIGPHAGHASPAFAGRVKVTGNDGSVSVDETFTGESTYLWQLRAFRAAVQDGTALAYSGAFSIGNMVALDAVASVAELRGRGIEFTPV